MQHYKTSDLLNQAVSIPITKRYGLKLQCFDQIYVIIVLHILFLKEK